MRKNTVLFLVLFLGLAAAITGRYLYMTPARVNGEKAPNFQYTNIQTGDSMKLSDLRGQIVLVDFWGSWCGPCLQEIPDLKALYAAYHKRGFTIVGVAIEKEARDLKVLAERFDLPWPYHRLDTSQSLRFFSAPVANRYDVKQVPTHFLINKEGVIMGVNPGIEQMRILLEAQL